VFEGEKTIVFWIGLIILGLASVSLFQQLWMIAVFQTRSIYMTRFTMFINQVPVIVGAVFFILIGLYMMKSGVKRKAE